MRSFTTVLLVAALGCSPQPDEPAATVEPAPMVRPTAPEPGTDVSLSLQVDDDGGSIDASSDANGTSVAAKVDVDAAKKKKPSN